jgi:hypothetical protein
MVALPLPVGSPSVAQLQDGTSSPSHPLANQWQHDTSVRTAAVAAVPGRLSRVRGPPGDAETTYVDDERSARWPAGPRAGRRRGPPRQRDRIRVHRRASLCPNRRNPPRRTPRTCEASTVQMHHEAVTYLLWETVKLDPATLKSEEFVMCLIN